MTQGDMVQVVSHPSSVYLTPNCLSVAGRGEVRLHSDSRRSDCKGSPSDADGVEVGLAKHLDPLWIQALL
jgi:hypothetical protein